MKHLPAILALAILITFGLACSDSGGGAATRENTGNPATKSGAAKSESGVTVESVKLTDDGGDEVTNFKTTDNPHRAVVKLSEIESGTKVKAVWTAVNAGGAKNEKILDKELETDSMMNQVNFSLSMPNPFPTGDYKLDIYLNGKLVKTVNYKVV